MSRFFKSAVVALTLSVSFTMASTSFASDFKSWQTEVVKLVAKKQVYPRAAMRQELEGRAKVKINIDRSGAITSYELVEPSGVNLRQGNRQSGRTSQPVACPAGQCQRVPAQLYSAAHLANSVIANPVIFCQSFPKFSAVSSRQPVPRKGLLCGAALFLEWIATPFHAEKASRLIPRDQSVLAHFAGALIDALFRIPQDGLITTKAALAYPDLMAFGSQGFDDRHRHTAFHIQDTAIAHMFSRRLG